MKTLTILGTFHMESQNDAHNLNDTERIYEFEAEFKNLISKLARFAPTKIFVEAEKTQQALLEKQFNDYLAGNHQSTNEIVQLAFPLAKQTGAKLLAVDWMEAGVGLVGYGQVAQRLEEDDKLSKELAAFAPYHTNLDKSITENLIHLNSQEEINKSKAFYTNLARVGNPDYYGVGWLVWWYQRNFNIFANISDYLEDGDRGLLLIGAAHRGILETFFQDSQTVELVESLKLL